MTSVRIFVWGSGGSGQLGLGNDEDFSLPQELVVSGIIDPDTVITGGCHSAGVNAAGELYVWGDSEKRQLSVTDEDAHVQKPSRTTLSSATATALVACGWSHTVIATTDQSLLSCGANESLQLGRVVSEEHPADRLHLVPFNIPVGRRVVSLACGWKHSLMALDDGSVFSWGSGRSGELGLGPTPLVAQTPTKVEALHGHSIDSVYCGWQHSIFHSSSTKTVLSCGNNRHGQLGAPKSTEGSRTRPFTVVAGAGPLLVEKIAVGWHFALCLAVDGSLYSWGKGSHGQLGLGTFETTETPTRVPFDKCVQAIACGSEHALVATDEGDLYTCGWGEHGNLGHGDVDNRSSFQKVQFFLERALRVTGVRAGGAVSIAFVDSDTS